MTRPDFTGIRPDVAEYITSLEQDTAQKQQELGQRDERIAQLETRVADIMQMLQNLQRLYFGKKSEKIRIPAMEDGAVQLSIFSQEEPVPISQPVEPETVEVSGHKRKKKRTQEEIIADLPVVIHEHKIPQDQLSCPRCGNEELEYIGKELVYTEYVRVPAHVDRHDHYVEKYACHSCEEGTGACENCPYAGTDACKTCADRPRTVIITGNLPEEYRHPFIKGSKASSSVFSQILYEKFELGLPEYRQEKEWERLGFPLSRQTMSNWILRADKDYMQPLTAYMLKTVKDESNVVNCDETPVKVLDEKTENGNPRKCHMWVVRSGKYEPKQIVVFNYRPSRAGKVPTGILAGYNHYFICDGYSGYNDLGRGAIRCGCWAHLRRKFYDSILNHNMDLPSLGREGVRYCDRLFRIEERLENVDPEERLRVRRKESLPIVEEFYTWLEARDPAYKGQKEAITYARNQKAELMRFLDDGRIPISNNAAENAIRPFVIGRKNWLFCKSNDGAVAAADAYSLVETAKANGLDVMKYLNYVFRRISIPDGNLTDDFIESLMPWNEAVRAECQRGYI